MLTSLYLFFDLMRLHSKKKTSHNFWLVRLHATQWLAVSLRFIVTYRCRRWVLKSEGEGGP